MYVLFILVWLSSGQVGSYVAAGHGAAECEAAKSAAVAQMQHEDTSHAIVAIRAVCSPLPPPADNEMVGKSL